MGSSGFKCDQMDIAKGLSTDCLIDYSTDCFMDYSMNCSIIHSLAPFASPQPHSSLPRPSFSLSNKAKTYTCVLLKSRSVPLLLGIVVVIPINPVRIPRLLVRPDAASLLRSQLHITSPPHHHSSHLRQHGGRLDLVCVLLVHRRNLRRQLAHLELVALRLAEADRVLFLLELQLHHLVRVREAPVACQLITPLTVSRWK